MDTMQPYTRLMSHILRIGVGLSSFLMAVGLLIALLQATPVPMPERNPTLRELLNQIFSGQFMSMTGFSAITLMFTGLVLLMLTPLSRVLATLFAFWAEKDWRFVGVATMVLLLLVEQVVYSLIIV